MGFTCVIHKLREVFRRGGGEPPLGRRVGAGRGGWAVTVRLPFPGAWRVDGDHSATVRRSLSGVIGVGRSAHRVDGRWDRGGDLPHMIGSSTDTVGGATREVRHGRLVE
ncbi:hypothetical protein Aglo03_60860 [Actinokineospora globicatena]|uniref:Uncharacterized protein n=1 Tax=Actinokineospora globicatena TaxID=103729 RepID=A0A9W6V9L3_9PSEU|nr:hypothetical protein Aglo03_60860 [Actinokineospora globicatena]